MKKIVGFIGKRFINEERDIRNTLKTALSVGASIDEACDLACIPKQVYEDWEYTHSLMTNIKSLMYALNITEYVDITDEILSTYTDYDIDRDLLNELKRNKYYAQDVYDLIEKCNYYKAKVIIYHLSNIHSPKKKTNDWKSSAWYLERTNPDRYGRNPNVKDKDTTIDKISIEFVDPTKQDTQDRLKALEQEVKDSLNGNKD